jgi:hypothetical protein
MEVSRQLHASASLPRTKNIHYVLYILLILQEFRGQDCCIKWILKLQSVQNWIHLAERLFAIFFFLIGPDINLLKYNLTVALQIPHRRILKALLFSRFVF